MKYKEIIVDNSEYLHVRCSGTLDFDSGINSWRNIVEALKLADHGKVLIDDRETVQETSVSNDYEHATIVCKLLHGICNKVAIVDSADKSFSNEFFETACVNRGLNLRYFEQEQDAIDWLLS